MVQRNWTSKREWRTLSQVEEASSSGQRRRNQMRERGFLLPNSERETVLDYWAYTWTGRGELKRREDKRGKVLNR